MSCQNLNLLIFAYTIIFLLVTASHSQKSPIKTTSALEINSKMTDTLTSMFYHIENTRKCGDNLQTFDVDLKNTWLKKFRTQVEKTFSLANSLNHLIGNVNQMSGDASKIDNIHLIESNLLPALSYFLFTQSPKSSSFDPSPEQKNETRQTPLKFFDPYMIGFGVLLLYDVDKAPEEILQTMSRKDRTKTIKCFYLYTKSNQSEEIDANSLIQNKACMPMEDADKETNTNKNIDNPSFSFHSTESLSTNSKSDEFFNNCNNW